MKRRNNERGFTLFELLLATGITVVTVTFVIQGFMAVANVWRCTEARTDTFRQARAALDCMVRELQAVAPALSGTGASPPVLVLDYDPATPVSDRVNEEVYAIASLPNGGRSDLCMVGYRCGWDAASNAYVLKRHFKDSNLVFNDFLAAAGKGSFGFTDFYSCDKAVEDDLAACVWNLTFRPCTAQTPGDYPHTSYTHPDDLPRWIEIGFKAVGATAAEKIKALPITRATWSDGSTSPAYRSAILPVMQQFSVRVRLAAATQP